VQHAGAERVVRVGAERDEGDLLVAHAGDAAERDEGVPVAPGRRAAVSGLGGPGRSAVRGGRGVGRGAGAGPAGTAVVVGVPASGGENGESDQRGGGAGPTVDTSVHGTPSGRDPGEGSDALWTGQRGR